ncbi:MAG: tagaturonate reductase [bacterium]
MTTKLPRLGRALLDTVRRERGDAVAVPDEALLDLPELAVQFGTGALLRGFVDDFLHRANQQAVFGGRIVAIASTGSVRDRALNDQDGLYTLVVEGIDRGQRVQERRVISSLSRAISAVDDWAEVLKVARAPELRFVFSNTTEVGIVHDDESTKDDTPPRSFPAKLTRFLFERASAFDYDVARGLTVIPCELIESNGSKLRHIVRTIAMRWELGDEFMQWMDDAVPFCNTLVDRIVPGAPREANVQALVGVLGYEDAMLTCCEPYRLFAIEGDDGLRARLTWAAVDDGIVIATDIAPYRKRKVHLLNGSHSLLACTALPLGCETVLDAMSQPALNRFVRNVMLNEITPMVEAEGAKEFAEAVLDRFQNPFIKHALIDITLQATMKMRVRVVPIVEKYIGSVGTVPQSLAFGFASYLLFMQGRFQTSRRAQGLSVPVDEQGEALKSLWVVVPDDSDAPVGELVWAACRDKNLWGIDLTTLPGFCEAVADHLWRMRAQGMSAALDHHLAASVA